MNDAKYRNRAGFTLIEVMIALTLAGLAIIFLAPLFLQATYNQQQLAGEITAAVLGLGKLAELECGSESGLAAKFDKPYQKFSWEATEDSTAYGKSIVLKVEWRDRNAILQEAAFQGYRVTE